MGTLWVQLLLNGMNISKSVSNDTHKKYEKNRKKRYEFPG